MSDIIPQNEKEKELVELAWKVPDAYHDFVLGTLVFCQDDNGQDTELVDEMIEFIKNNPEATTSEVLSWQVDLMNEYNDRRELMGLPLLWLG